MTFSLYGLLLGLGFVVFWTLFETVLKSALPPKSRSHSLTLALVFVSLGALLGARLYHLWTDWELYAQQDWQTWFAVWNGGLGIYGALLGGHIGLALWKRTWGKSLSWWLLLDAAAFGVPLGQAIGRWGNYVNTELFGLPSDLPWAIFIPVQFRPDEFISFSTFHPLFLYESIAMLFVGGFFLLLWKKYSSLFPFGTGWYFGSYLFAYGSVRFCLELLRPVSAAGWWGLSIAQWVSLLATAIGLVLFSHAFRLQWSNESSLAAPATTASVVPARADVARQKSSRTRVRPKSRARGK